MEEDIEKILEEREKTHGIYKDVAQLYSYIIGWEDFRTSTLSASKRMSLDMIAGKIARILAGDSCHIDHWKDIAGYAMLVVKELDGNNNV